MLKQLIKHGIVPKGEYLGASYLGGYVLGAYPDHMRVKNVPTVPLVGAVLQVLSLAVEKFRVGGIAAKLRPHAESVGIGLIGSYLTTIGTSHGYPKSGRSRVVVSSGDVAKLKAAVPGATILGVSEQAPPGRELSASDIEAIARRVR